MSLRNLLNLSAILLSLTLAASASGQQGSKGPQKDPNLPPLSGMIEGPIYWTYGVSTEPGVFFKNPAAETEYLGFNENGSLIRNEGNGKVYYWKLTNPQTMAGTLTVVANSYKEVPLDVFASLQNAPQSVHYYLAQHGIGPKPVPAAPPPPPPNPDKSAGLFGDNPRQSLQGLAPPTASTAAASPYEIAGKNASIQEGVLTFTLANGAKSKPYNVSRPTFMANAPQSAGSSGTWIALQDGGKGIMFNVQADNSVTGKEIQPQVVQMMLQTAPKTR